MNTNKIIIIIIFIAVIICYFNTNNVEHFYNRNFLYPYVFNPWYSPIYMPYIVDLPFAGADGRNAYYTPFSNIMYNI
jgi:hypothetical protein